MLMRVGAASSWFWEDDLVTTLQSLRHAKMHVRIPQMFDGTLDDARIGGVFRVVDDANTIDVRYSLMCKVKSCHKGVVAPEVSAGL